MRVLLVGAGASNRAGYPLARELLPRIEKAATQTALSNFRTAWETWIAKRNALPEEYKVLLSSPNPEISFSLMDLLEAAGYEHMSDATAARAALLECLKWYFSFKHHEDRNRQADRAYLKSLLRGLRAGDVVITLNWDTTAERTLGELGRWNPTTGYGFDHGLVISEAPILSVGDSGEKQMLPSELPLLKLHGSFGWYRSSTDSLYFSDIFLREFGFERNGRPLYFRDTSAPSFDPETDPVLLYPSYLKRLDNKELQTVWHKAKQALDEGDEVEIWGYSLPSSDTAVRTLLNALVFRLEGNEVEVRVHNPNRGAQDRWREFLGPGARVDSERLE